MGPLGPWLEIRRELPVGAFLCVIHGPTAGRRWETSAAREQLHHAAAAAGVRRRFAPHQLRHGVRIAAMSMNPSVHPMCDAVSTSTRLILLRTGSSCRRTLVDRFVG
jgi:integrase